MAASESRIRWWPGAVVLAMACVLTGWIWLAKPDSSEQIRQDKVMLTMGVMLLSAILTFLWLLFFARLPAKIRRRVVMGSLLVGLACLGMFRYRGVDGDLIPQFSFRFGGADTNLGAEDGVLTGARDYAQFLGPARDGRVDRVALIRDWTAHPPTLLWRRPVGAGWAGFAVAGDVAVTQEQHSAEERVTAYELSSGKLLWASREVASYANPIAGEGPRATPTISDDVVFAMGATGILTALELSSGKLLWKRDVLSEHGAKLPEWGKSNSPLVLDQRVYVSVGGPGASLVAYNRQSGEVLASGGDDPAGYASPMLVSIGGIEQIVQFNANSLAGHDRQNAEVLWRVDWPPRQPNVAQPLFVPPDRLLASSGYGIGSKIFRIILGPDRSEGARVEELWASRRLKAKFTNVVLHEGYVYGLDDGVMVCLDPQTGERMWKRGRYGHGQVILVGDVLLVQGEHGEVFLVDPSPDALKELTSFQALDGKTWNPPALAGKYLLVRNDRQAALYELPVRPTSSSMFP